MAAWISTAPVMAESKVPITIKKPVVGWQGYYQTGRWTQVTVPVVVAEGSEDSAKVSLEVSAVDSDGNRVVFISPSQSLKPGNHQLSGVFKAGRLDGEVSVKVTPEQPAWQGTPGLCDWLKPSLKPSVRLVVTVGNPRGFDFEDDAAKYGAVVKIISAKIEDLPANPLAYDGVSALVLAGPLGMSEALSNALRDWVSAGGRLIISLSQQTSSARESVKSLTGWLPVTIGEQPVTVREFGGLETFSGKTSRIPFTGTFSIPSLKIEAGETLAASRSDAFLVRAPYGLGSVSVLAMDLTTAPMSEWKSLSPFCARLAGLNSTEETNERTLHQGSQLSSTGITDLATQIHATQEQFEQLNRPTPWFVMGVLFSLLVFIGPVDYFVVHYLLKKPQLTWITFPCWLVLFSTLTFWSAASFNGTSQHANQLDIINVDAVNGTARGRHLINLYSPATVQTSVSVQTIPMSKVSPANSDVRVCWQGVPESTFGGMLRETSFEQGAEYTQQPDGQLTQLPIMQWSSKSLVAESFQSADGLVTSDLKASPTGRLMGSVLHRCSDSIEDWMIVYRTVSYRPLKYKDDPISLPFPPNQVFRVEQPSVYSRDLRPFLTGIITMATPRAGMKAAYDPSQPRSSYDPLSLDPHNLIRVLTFHDHIGAERYTGLSNQLLGAEDCSHLLKLGRAILFGRLKQPVATVLEDQKEIEPDRRTSFIRIILPVTPSSTTMKELRRVIPE